MGYIGEANGLGAGGPMGGLSARNCCSTPLLPFFDYVW